MLHGATPIGGLFPPRQQALLTYLLIHREAAQQRRAVAFKFWPESTEKQALTNLRRELHTLKKTSPEIEKFIHIQHHTVGWRGDAPYRLDLAEFDRAIGRAETARADGRASLVREMLTNALSIYKGPLAPEIYEEWIIPTREEYLYKYLRTLEQLFEIAVEDEDYSAAAQYAEQAISHEPLNEAWYRRIINLHADAGNRAEALRIFNLCAETLRFELGVEPSLETQEAFQRLRRREKTGRSRNFPSQNTPFIGREAELDALGQLLRKRECRLLSIVGPGGVGKTRLAIQLARRAEIDFVGEFEHGIFFVPLVSVESPDQMVTAISASLGLVFTPDEDPLTQILNFLAGKPLLLVLDNFEHLSRGRGLILRLRQEAPDATLLVTSRVRLDLKQEWVYELVGLDYEAGDDGRQIDEPAAVRLFYSRASRIHAQIADQKSDNSAVKEICRLLDGNPLAIELAASWAGALTPREILEEVNTGLDFLTATQGDVPARHRSMRAVFDHSWRLLPSVERKLLRALSVFQGVFERQAAVIIAGASVRVLSSLVNKGLLDRRPNGYYEMHRLLQQFSSEKLAVDHVQSRQIFERYRRFYMNLLQDQRESLAGADAMTAAQRILDDLDQIRIAWNLAVEAADVTDLDRVVDSLYLFYDLRGWFDEGAEQFFSAAAGLIRVSDEGEEARLVYWKLRIYQARMEYRRGRYDRAWEIVEGCREELGDKNHAEIDSLSSLLLGQISFRRGDYESAKSYLLSSLEIFRELQNQTETATALNFLGDVYRSLGDYHKARACLLEALALRKERGNPARIADTLNTLGIVVSALGDYSNGLTLFQESLSIRRALDDPWGTAKTLNNLAILYTWMDDYARAKELHEESLRLRREVGNPFGVAIALHNLGNIARLLENPLEAEQHFHEALAIRRQINARHGIASTLNMLAILAHESSDYVGARGYFEEALVIAMEIRAIPTLLAIIEGVCGLLIQQGETLLAAEAISFVIANPGTESDTREKAKERLTMLQRKVDTEGEELPEVDLGSMELSTLVQRLQEVLKRS